MHFVRFSSEKWRATKSHTMVQCHHTGNQIEQLAHSKCSHAAGPTLVINCLDSIGSSILNWVCLKTKWEQPNCQQQLFLNQFNTTLSTRG